MESTFYKKKRRFGPEEEVNVHFSTGQTILGIAKIRVSDLNDEKIEIRALCDNGLEINLISKRVLQNLRVKCEPVATTFYGIGGTDLGSSYGEVNLKIQLKTGNFITNRFHVAKEITNYYPINAKEHDWSNIKDNLADDDYAKPGKINALLGVGIWIQIIQEGIVRSPDNKGIAHSTKLGYVIYESDYDIHQLDPQVCHLQDGPSDTQLMNQIKRLWEIEEIMGTIMPRNSSFRYSEIYFIGRNV